uniref:Movement protein n=1 Tax=Alfalfa mosaic virus TaxID=12321 RepID=A0A343FMH3_AMV|nr:movement protein [Alfalfa mosaic virus]
MENTKTNASSSGMSSSSSFSVSYAEEKILADEVSKMNSMLILGPNQLKLCTQLGLSNGAAPVVLSLVSKEKKSIMNRMLPKIGQRMYVHHSAIYLLYMPNILKSSSGRITLKLFNEATGELVDVDTDHDATQACIFVGRYPRSILAKYAAKVLDLKLVAHAVVSTNVNSAVGVLYPPWDDELSGKHILERGADFLKFPTVETEPVRDLLNTGKLTDFVLDRTRLGVGSKMDPSPVLLEPRAKIAGKAKTVFIPEGPSVPNTTKNGVASTVRIDAGSPNGLGVRKGFTYESLINDAISPPL